ncbi:hypothetical protein Ddye_017506 [Dipteronia dyeriana]|uniref:ATP synthase delta chain, chloroplastic n=1 Tax=Dipteronia dyeriana TaxID=168575 RepID=A0AAD9U8V7_9ROSI|nr:hypothetical protein Ddye_017506 [Dipteronia dyeriana]
MNKYRFSVYFEPLTMDTLSTSVSTSLKVPSLHSTTPHRDFFLFKPPYPYTSQQIFPHNHHQHNSHLYSSTTKLPNNKKTSSVTAKNLNPPPLLASSGTSSPLKPANPNNVYRKPASGYAAALLDKALCDDSVELTRKDVKRVSNLLKKEQIQAILNDPFVGEKEKGEVVKKVVKIRKVNRFLAGLVKMMVERNKVGMVSEVLDEFEKIYQELCGTRTVFVSSEKKMEENQLFEIARRVQMLSGAVNVKVMNLVEDGVPSFAL